MRYFRFSFLVPATIHATIVLYSLEWEWLGLWRWGLAVIGGIIWMGGEAFAFAAAPSRPTPIWGWTTLLALVVSATMTMSYYLNGGQQWDSATRAIVAIVYSVGLAVYVFLLLLAWERGDEIALSREEEKDRQAARQREIELSISAQQAKAGVLRAEAAKIRAEARRAVPPAPAQPQLPPPPAAVGYICPDCGATSTTLAYHASHRRWCKARRNK